MAKPKTSEEYLSNLTPDKRAALEKLRQDLRAAAPGVEERISYGVPGFRLGGKMLVWMGAGKNHCSFYPGGVVPEFADELEAYETSKGTTRFPPGKPLPSVLVRKLVKARIAAIAGDRPRPAGRVRRPRA